MALATRTSSPRARLVRIARTRFPKPGRRNVAPVAVALVFQVLVLQLLLELAALQLTPHAVLQPSPQIAVASVPSGHSHRSKLLPLTHTPGFMPPVRQDLRHTYANGICAIHV